MVSGKPPRRSKLPNDPVTIDLTADPVAAKAKRVFDAMMTMRKIDIATLEKAAAAA